MSRTIAYALIALVAGSGLALAAKKTVTLAVDGMTCASCPYQVEAALRNVDGVLSARASLSEKSAVVTFDDTKADISALVAATAASGFPSRVK